MGLDRGNGRSSFAAQFMVNTVVKKKRSGNDSVLPYEINWETETPAYTSDDYTEGNTNSSIGRQTTDSIRSYDPSTAGYDYCLAQGGDNTRPWTTIIEKLANAGQSIDATAGLRMQFLIGPDDTGADANGRLSLFSGEANASGQPLNNGLEFWGAINGSGYGRAMQVTVDDVTTALWYVSASGATWPPASPPEDQWMQLSLEFPANGNGVVTQYIGILSSNTASGPMPETPTKVVITKTINMDISSLSALNRIAINTSTDWYLKTMVPYIWIGKLTDDWPIALPAATQGTVSYD